MPPVASVRSEGRIVAIINIIMESTFTQNRSTELTHHHPESIDTATGLAADPDLSKNRVKDIFSTIATKYERFNAVSSFGTYRIWLNKLTDKLLLEARTSCVLDVAGGTGDVTFALAKKHHPTSIICTDLVPEMLDVAASKLERGEGEGVDISFQVVDATDIPFPDNSFDAVSIAYGLRNIPDRMRALEEMYRVLKPGGMLACLDFSTPKNPVLKGLYRIYLDHMIPFWGKLLTGNRDGFVYLTKSIKAFPDQQGVAEMFADAGFTEVEFCNCSGGIAAIHTGKKPLSEHPETAGAPIENSDKDVQR